MFYKKTKQKITTATCNIFHYTIQTKTTHIHICTYNTSDAKQQYALFHYSSRILTIRAYICIFSSLYQHNFIYYWVWGIIVVMSNCVCRYLCFMLFCLRGTLNTLTKQPQYMYQVIINKNYNNNNNNNNGFL